MTKSARSESAQSRPWRRWLWASAGLGLLVAAVLAGPALWGGSGRPGQASSVALSLPVAAQVQFALSVAVTPQGARVVVDDGPASVGGAVARVAPNSEHVVRAELEGYSPAERRVTLVSDTAMTIELTALPAPSSSEASPARAPDALRKSWATAGRYPQPKAGSPSAPAAKVGGANGPDCSPPYYFVGGIKTFKPECI